MTSLREKLEAVNITPQNVGSGLNRHERRKLAVVGYIPEKKKVEETPRKPGEKRVFRISKEKMQTGNLK
jgi:hypothetical protein